MRVESILFVVVGMVAIVMISLVALAIWGFNVLGMDALVWLPKTKEERKKYLFDKYLEKIQLLKFRLIRLMQEQAEDVDDPEKKEICDMAVQLLREEAVKFDYNCRKRTFRFWKNWDYDEVAGIVAQQTDDFVIRSVPIDILKEFRRLAWAVFFTQAGIGKEKIK